MRILLIGGAGFLGKNTAVALIAAGHQVFVLDRMRLHNRERSILAGVSAFFDADLADFNEVFGIIDRNSIQVVVNFASMLLPSSNFDAFSAEMASGSFPLFRQINSLAERGVKYVFISSGGVIYGRSSAAKIKETEKRQPINLYGLSKLMIEEYIEFAGRAYGLKYLILRPSNPYGPHQNPYGRQGFIAVAMDRIFKGEIVEVWGDGSVVRDYIYVADLANAFNKLIEAGCWNETFNVGSGEGFSIKRVLDLMQRVTGIQPKVNYLARRAVDADHLILDITKLGTTIDFRPRNLEVGLGDYYKSISSEK
jgi:UDP-glucose 4-epimerase